MKYFILYNPHAGNGTGKERARALDGILDGAKEYHSMTDVIYEYFFESVIENGSTIVICGGDGTLNRFINDCQNIPDNKILYYPCGSGNDFYFDITGNKNGKPIEINEYLKNLPTVTVNGKKRRFLNGVGYGIDGYCCEIGDKQRSENPGKEINYAGIAVKGLLFHFKPRNAAVTIDGTTEKYKKTWLAPTMNGRCYGGGMIPTPDQKRKGNDKKLSLLLFHGSGKLKTLVIFPSIFKGEHLKHGECCKVIEGKEITVRFDKPTAIQIDGETILGVTEYSAKI